MGQLPGPCHRALPESTTKDRRPTGPSSVDRKIPLNENPCIHQGSAEPELIPRSCAAGRAAEATSGPHPHPLCTGRRTLSPSPVPVTSARERRGRSLHRHNKRACIRLMKRGAPSETSRIDLPVATRKYVCNKSQVNSSRLKMAMGVMAQLHAFVSVHGTVYPLEFISLCVNYTATGGTAE